MTVKKHVFVTKWVGKARNPEILIPIDAARSGDLENRGFGQKIQTNIGEQVDFSVVRGSQIGGAGVAGVENSVWGLVLGS